MNTEQRKEYNKKYYADNKQRIVDLMLKKLECPHCKHPISHSNLNRHQTSPICLRRRSKIPTDIETLKEQVEKLIIEVQEMKSKYIN